MGTKRRPTKSSAKSEKPLERASDDEHHDPKVESGEDESGSDAASESEDSNVSDEEIIEEDSEEGSEEEEDDGEESSLSADSDDDEDKNSMGPGDGGTHYGSEEEISSDEEHQRNTIGNVPLHWYDEFDHIGYDKSGKKIIRSEGMDEVDKALAARDDPNYRRSIYDARNDEDVVLTDRELVMVTRMLAGKFPHPEVNAEPDYVDWYTSVKMVTPVSSAPEPKRRFIPSKWERMKVMKIVRGINEGHYKFGPGKKAPPKPKTYLLWGENDEVEDEDGSVRRRNKGPRHIPAPKVAPPGHAESYHPPPEYLLDEEELKEWEAQDPEDRAKNFVPTDHTALRKVPAYKSFIRERFERCLDLYLCARAEKQRLNIDPESLVPRLPLPQELRPYPTTGAISYLGHYGRVRAIAVDPTGQWLATGGDDLVVKLWEVESGRCVRSWDVSSVVVKLRPKEEPVRRRNKATPVTETEEKDFVEAATNEQKPEDQEAIQKLAWNPAQHKHILAVAVGRKVVLLYTGTIVHGGESTALDVEATSRILSGTGATKGTTTVAVTLEGEQKTTKKYNVTWESSENKSMSPSAVVGGQNCLSVVIGFDDPLYLDVSDISWHAKGEYLATVSQCTAKGGGQVMIHHITKRQSQAPFTTRMKGDVQCVTFHPTKPVFFLATKTHVSVYHLAKQVLLKRLTTGAKWISSMSIHPGGDNLIVGSYDRRVCWFDLDLSSKPFKTLKYHTAATRQVAFHERYPLMASASDDGSVHIFHARVFDDLIQNPLIVPVKTIKAHGIINGLGVLNCAFHPTQPWIFTSGADGIVRLYQNIP